MHVCVFLGTCTCGAGFTGELCEHKCDSGQFGVDCDQKCQCAIGNYISCDPVNGNCICKPEWKGILYTTHHLASASFFCLLSFWLGAIDSGIIHLWFWSGIR